MSLTKERKGRYTRKLYFRHRAGDRLAHVNETVLDELLGEDIAVEVQRMLARRRLQFRHVVQGGRRRQRTYVRSKTAVHTHAIALETTRRILKEDRYARRSLARIDRSRVDVEAKLVGPFYLRVKQKCI